MLFFFFVKKHYLLMRLYRLLQFLIAVIWPACADSLFIPNRSCIARDYNVILNLLLHIFA